MMSAQELEAVFANVLRALRPGGKFVFDLNLREGFVDRWKGQAVEVKERTVVVTTSGFDPRTDLARVEFIVFEAEGDGRWSASSRSTTATFAR